MNEPDKNLLKLGVPIYVHPDAEVLPALRGRIAYVQELKGWGVLAAIPPTDGSEGYFPVRLPWKHFDLVNVSPIGQEEV